MTPDILPLYRRVVWLVMLFLLIGHIMLFSATGVLGLQRHGSEFYFLTRQFFGAIAGLCLMVGLSKIPYQFWGRIAYLVLGLQILLVGATYVPGIGHHAGGATRWLRLGPVTFQPSELAKISLAIYFAALLALNEKAKFRGKRWAWSLLPVLVLLLLVFRQNDLGTTALVTGMMLATLFLSGIRPLYFFSMIGSGSILIVIAILKSAYRRRRLFAFLDPWNDPQGSGFQSIQSYLSFHSGKVLGVGLGNGNSKLFFLPEVHTDFIFALIGEELGFIGAASLLVLFVYFGFLLFKIAFRAKDSFGTYLAFGLAIALIMQIAVNVGGVTGVLPMKGLPLPFISWGRSALIVNLVAMGILLNILRQSAIIPTPAQT